MIEPNSLASTRAAFAAKYADKASDWGGHSGPGSDPFYVQPYRSFVETFLRANAIRSVVDIGCGDWQFSRFVDFGDADYLGLDLVEPLIRRNRDRFGSDRRRFEIMPDDLDAVPGGDLLLVKDVLQHLPTTHVHAFRAGIFPKFRYALVTNSWRKDGGVPVNVDVAPGGFRCLDLHRAPFDWPDPCVLQHATAAWEEVRTLLYVRDR